MFLNRWVTQGLGHPAPIPSQPRPHVLLPLVDLPPQAHLHLTTHLHPTILGWVVLLSLLRLGVLLQVATTTIGQAVLLQEDITTTHPAVLHPAGLILIQPAASHQAGTITLQPQQQSTEEFQSLSR